MDKNTKDILIIGGVGVAAYLIYKAWKGGGISSAFGGVGSLASGAGELAGGALNTSGGALNVIGETAASVGKDLNVIGTNLNKVAEVAPLVTGIIPKSTPINSYLTLGNSAASIPLGIGGWGGIGLDLGRPLVKLAASKNFMSFVAPLPTAVYSFFTGKKSSNQAPTYNKVAETITPNLNKLNTSAHKQSFAGATISSNVPAGAIAKSGSLITWSKTATKEQILAGLRASK